MDSSQEKPNNVEDSANTKFTNSDEMVDEKQRETLDLDNEDSANTKFTNSDEMVDEKQRETLDLDNEQRSESTKEDGKMRTETPQKDDDLLRVQLTTDHLNGHHEQMQEIKLY
jgi:hypothetical protein